MIVPQKWSNASASDLASDRRVDFAALAA